MRETYKIRNGSKKLNLIDRYINCCVVTNPSMNFLLNCDIVPEIHSNIFK